jgi:prephenate dehydratase
LKDFSKNNLTISTLGPPGTCSEYSSEYFLNANNFTGQIILFNSFEEAIEALIAQKSDIAIVPSAYQNFAKLLFNNRDYIKITSSFILETPELAIAGKNSNSYIVKKVATHPSPSSMIENYYPDVEIIFAESNSKAAIMLIEGKVDACLTTSICIEKYGLNVIKNFGSISMSWNVFKKIL